MSSRTRRVPSVLVAALLLVGGANLAAYAANGRPLLLGAKNTESRTAVVTNTGKGPALSLRTRSSAPPLAVSSSRKVARLNADAVDGLSASALQTRARVYTLPVGPQAPATVFTFPGLPAGQWLVTYAVRGSLELDRCELTTDTGQLGRGLAYATVSRLSGVERASVNGSAVVDARTTSWVLSCGATGPISWDVEAGSASTVSFTSLDTVTTGAATAVAD